MHGLHAKPAKASVEWAPILQCNGAVIKHCRGGRMEALQVAAVWRLERRDLLTLLLRRGDRLRCEGGTVWCTVDGAAQDVVLEAGQMYEARTDQRLHASGLRHGRLSMLSGGGPARAA
jgi:hypothetical protein